MPATFMMPENKSIFENPSGTMQNNALQIPAIIKKPKRPRGEYKITPIDPSLTPSGQVANTSFWTEDEHKKFVDAVRLYGRNVQRIGDHMGHTRTHAQIACRITNVQLQIRRNPNLDYADIL